MRVENTVQIPAPLERSWELIQDVPSIAPCIPGAELTEVVSDDAWRGKVRIKVGPTALQFMGDIERKEVDADAHRMLLTADGVQNLITHFGALRAQLQPAVSDKPPANGQFLQLDAPVVEITVTPDGAFVGMLLRTLTYGWIGCAFRAADARSIGEYLVRGLGAEAEPPTA